MAEIGSRDELAAMIEGKTDDEINAGVAELGTEKVLGQIFEQRTPWAFEPRCKRDRETLLTMGIEPFGQTLTRNVTQ